MNQAHNRKGFHALFSAAKAHSLGRLCFDVDPIRSNIEDSGEGVSHGVHVRGQLRLLSNDSGIHVIDPPAFLFNPSHHFLEHQETICVFEGRIMVGKVLSYIPFSKSTNQGVNDGMGQYIRVGMPQETHGMRDEDSAQGQRATLDKAVSIISKADATQSISLLLPSRLLKNTHLRRYPHSSTLRRTSMYASFFGILGALHLVVFEQPEHLVFFSNPLVA